MLGTKNGETDRRTYTCTRIHTRIHMDICITKSSPMHFKTCLETTEHIVLSERTEMSIFLSNKLGFVVKGLLFLLSVGYWSVSDSRPCPEVTPGKCYCQDFQWTLSLLLTFSVEPINLNVSHRQHYKHYKLRFRLRKILVTFTYLWDQIEVYSN